MTTRRSFIKTTGQLGLGMAAITLPRLTHGQILGANDHINCAVIGVRSRAKAHVSAINALKNTTLLYSCDVDDVILEAHNI